MMFENQDDITMLYIIYHMKRSFLTSSVNTFNKYMLWLYVT